MTDQTRVEKKTKGGDTGPAGRQVEHDAAEEADYYFTQLSQRISDESVDVFFSLTDPENV